MIEKIVKMISNLKILSKINEIIDGLNTHTANMNNPHNVTAEQLGLATAYVYKGSITNFSDLPTNAQNGWVYSVENEHTDSAGILHPAGANFAWNGSKWDDLGGSLSGYAKSVNSQSPDNKGNVNLTLVESLEKNTEDKLVVHNSDGSIQELEVGKKYTINNKLPDANDNYEIEEFEGYWKSNEPVSVGDVRFLKGRNNTKYLLECVQSGITGTEQPTISEDTILADYSDNTAQWGVRKLTKFQENSGVPVGFEYFSTNPNIPAGSIPLFGGEYSREVYSDLWSWVQEQAGYLIEESEWQEKSAANGGNVPFYSKGNGTTTFRVPSLNCWVKGANGIEEVGSYLSAGLPNITGGISTQGIFNNAVPYGAFEVSEGNIFSESGANQYNSKLFNFDASRSSSVYGNSDTVQPKSIVGMWLVKAYGTVTNVGSTDVANIAQGLTELENRVTPIANGGTGASTAEKARENLGLATVASTGSYNDLSNKPSIPYSASATAIGGASASKPAVVVETYKSKTSWYRKYSDGWIEQGGVYDSGSIQAGISTTITFLKAFTVNPLTVSLSVMRGDNNNLANVPNIGSFSKTSMYLYAGRFTSTGGTRYFSWYACGY